MAPICIYFATAFALIVELINMRIRKKSIRKKPESTPASEASKP